MTAAIHPFPAGRGKSAQRPERLRLSFLVDLRDVLRVRRAIVALAHPSVDIVTVKRVRGDSRVQMTIGLEPGIAGETMDRLMREVNVGAFGALVPARAQSPFHVDHARSSPTERR